MDGSLCVCDVCDVYRMKNAGPLSWLPIVIIPYMAWIIENLYHDDDPNERPKLSDFH